METELHRGEVHMINDLLGTATFKVINKTQHVSIHDTGGASEPADLLSLIKIYIWPLFCGMDLVAKLRMFLTL